MEFRKFKKKVESSFGQVYFFVESFIFFEKEIKKIIKSNLVDGVTFRDSAFESQSSPQMRDYLEKNAITYSTYAGLSGVSGAVDSDSQILSLLLNNTQINNPLDLNLSFLKSKLQLSHFNYAVVSVSSMEHYTDLITRLENVGSLTQKQAKLVTKLKQEPHGRLSCIDDYGAAQKKNSVN
ncbi:hypothetical protein OAS14_00645 [Alphaproteobacteria bacterium]|nr:hypothetical protein [Alphaproteobacteria bacterium]